MILTYISFTNHSVDRVCERHPEIQKQKVRKYAEKEAKAFLEDKLREWLSNAWKINNQLRRKSDREWKITLTDWTHKIVYTKVAMWELLIITYGFKTENNKLERKILQMLPSTSTSVYRSKHKNTDKYKKI